MTDDLIDTLLDLDGIEEVRVETSIYVTHSLRNTGETDESFQEIRKRIISEDKFQKIADEFGLRHHGTIDVLGDYHLKDRFSHKYTIENEDYEETDDD